MQNKQKTRNYWFRVIMAVVLMIGSFSLSGQRLMEKMDRGVVAIPKSSSSIFISWRHFATDPEEIAYNIYYKISANGAETKLNTQPITGSTNFLASLNTANNDYIFSVRSVIGATERKEPGSFTLKKGSFATRIVKDFDFEPAPFKDSIGNPLVMPMKFCWPVDLNGDGKYDFVLDRLGYGNTAEDGSGGSEEFVSPMIDAYSSEGEFLWRVLVGVNIKISSGHADMVTAYDMNGDGKGEVLMIVGEGTTFSDGKKIVGKNGTVTDYRKLPGSAPQWLSIIDGATGVELDRTEIPYFDQLKTTRTDSWKDMTGHFIIAYLDGIKPSLIYQYKNRRLDDGFQGGMAAWSFVDGKLKLEWSHLNYPNEAEFHQVRVADVDGDGCDEFIEGGFVIDHDGSMLYRLQDVVHGDRHTTADIDPDRPGLEHFVIQQNNPKTMGMGIFDATNGKTIKATYMSGVGDVGRGACAAFDVSRRGLQFFSTMSGFYDSKGNLIEGAEKLFPAEPVWWGGTLARHHMSPIGSGGNNVAPFLYDTNSKTFGRQGNLYNEGPTGNSDGTYYWQTYGAGRPAFWGDLFGDWREEMIGERRDHSGFVILSTYDVASTRIYSLMQNPAYRGQTTARGYYQSADVDFYMANDMPLPPIAPVQKADLYFKGGNTWGNFMDSTFTDKSFANGKSVMFDIRGANSTVEINSNISPEKVYIINGKGKNYTFNFTGNGQWSGAMGLIKTQQGDATLNGNLPYTGITRISEGRLFVNGTITGKVLVNARGVIGGNAILNGGIDLEIGLNVEGGRIEPGNGNNQLGEITINGNLYLPGRNNLAFDLNYADQKKNDKLHINGNFTANGTNHTIVITSTTKPTADEITLVTFTGTTNVTPSTFKVNGLDGIPYEIIIENNSLKLKTSNSRIATNVRWVGSTSNVWDFQTKNFSSGNYADNFAPGDTVSFDDQASRKTVTINEAMPVGGLSFNNNTDYSISGQGYISGNGGLTKVGDGKLSILTSENSFTGPVQIIGGTLEVSSLKEGGLPSSIGASSTAANNWVMTNATLQTTAQMSTNRNMTVNGSLTINNPLSNNSVLISGNMQGDSIWLDLKGKGTLTLQGKNNFRSVTIREGLLLLGSVDANRYSLGTNLAADKKAKITLLGGILRMHDGGNTSYSSDDFSNDMIVPEGCNARLDIPTRWAISGKLTGGGALTVQTTYVRGDFQGDWSKFTGIINFINNGKDSDVRFSNPTAYNLSAAEINLGSGTSTYCTVRGGKVAIVGTVLFGALSGNGNINGLTSVTVGSKNVNATYNGVIGSGSGKLTKVGTGMQTLTGANLYTGGTVVNGGKLWVANTTACAVGTGSVTINNGGAFGGIGTVTGNVIINNGGAVDLKDSATNAFTVKDLKFHESGKVILDINPFKFAPKVDQIKISGTTPVVIKGELVLNYIGQSSFIAGQTYKIIDCPAGVSGSFSSITPAPEGMIWNQDRLASEGIIELAIDNGKYDALVKKMNVYPNPVVKTCEVLIGQGLGEVSIELFSTNGTLVWAGKTADEKYSLDMDSYPAGVYTLKLYNKEFKKTINIIKK